MILLREHSMEFALLGKQVAELITTTSGSRTNDELAKFGIKKTSLYTQLLVRSMGLRGLGNGDIQFRAYNEDHKIVMAQRAGVDTLNELQINLHMDMPTYEESLRHAEGGGRSLS